MLSDWRTGAGGRGFGEVGRVGGGGDPFPEGFRKAAHGAPG